MADTSDPKQQQPQHQRPRGIAAAAIEGAREGEQSVNPDDVTGSLARPAPGMTKQPEPSPSSTNQYTGVTGGLTEDQDNDEEERRRAGGSDPDAAPDEPAER